MAQLRNNARNRLQYKNENLIAEGKKPLSEEEYIDNGAYPSRRSLTAIRPVETIFPDRG